MTEETRSIWFCRQLWLFTEEDNIESESRLNRFCKLEINFPKYSL